MRRREGGKEKDREGQKEGRTEEEKAIMRVGGKESGLEGERERRTVGEGRRKAGRRWEGVH